MSEFNLVDASRAGQKALLGFYGGSGSGKTLSSLLVARGLVGPSGKIAMIDSENKRGHIFSDVVPGGYKVIDLSPPFSPERYGDALAAAEAAGMEAVIVDSMSHEHAGEGGVLDMQEAELDRMAGDNWQKRESCKMAAWIKPKMEHKKFLGRLLRSKVHVLLCFRGEQKTRMAKGSSGKMEVYTDDHYSPIFDPRFIFELLITFEMLTREGQGGYTIAHKTTHPKVVPLLPGADQQIGIEFGKRLADWCTGTDIKGAAAADRQLTPKQKLWNATRVVHKGAAPALLQWLRDEGILGSNETLEGQTDARFEEMTTKATAILTR